MLWELFVVETILTVLQMGLVFVISLIYNKKAASPGAAFLYT